MTEPIQNTIADFIWGPDEAGDRYERLSKFLATCAHERYILSKRQREAASIDSDIGTIISNIKTESGHSKWQITSRSTDNRNTAVADCVVRMMLMTAATTENGAFGGFLTFLWRDDETVVDFLDRVYPRMVVGAVQDQPINTRNLNVSTLISRADIRIRSTDKMSDHLYLIYGKSFKTLLVFTHRSFLEYSIERLKTDRVDLEHTTVEALKCGCLHPKLLLETLHTLDLLFPPFGSKKSRRFLEKWVSHKQLDGRLLAGPAYSFEFSQPPKDLHGLYEQYPYWGRQLARLLREVDDPTPVTWWQRYTERGRSPRRMFECAVAALVVTAFSALVATALAAVQVWIAYCDWDGAPSRSWCPK